MLISITEPIMVTELYKVQQFETHINFFMHYHSVFDMDADVLL